MVQSEKFRYYSFHILNVRCVETFPNAKIIDYQIIPNHITMMFIPQLEI
jgi:hypothetical protein